MASLRGLGCDTRESKGWCGSSVDHDGGRGGGDWAQVTEILRGHLNKIV